MAMYLNLSAQNDNLQLDQQQDNNSAPHTPLNQVDSQQSLPSITGKRKCMDKESGGSSSNSGKGMRTIDPFSLMGEDSGSGKFFKRQRLDSVNSSDFSIPLTTNDETFTSSYVFLHSTVSRPASSNNNNNNQNQPSSQTSYQTGYQSNNGPEEERILREEFFSQQQLPQGFLSSGGASGSFGNLAGYALPHYPVAPPQAASPYMLPSFGPPLMQAPPVPHYNNGYFPSMQAPPPDLYYPRAEQLYSRPSYPPAAMMGGGGGGGQPSSLPEEFIAETKLSKNIKKMTTVLGQIPGLEKIRWQSILQGTRSPDVGERETQRRVKEAETIGARLFGGDIDKLLGSILNQHLDFLVTYVANLKNGKKKHNKIRMQLSKVLQDAAAANNNNNNSNNNSPQSD